ncbi:tyrosine--tRNA ligase [Candidatus Neomarinimicrobiota bacterium]
MKFPPVNEQMDLLKKGVEQIIPEEDLVRKIEGSLQTGKQLKAKLGCDPSRPDLHLGHAVVLRKLRHFQDLGHEAILLVGDFTAMIGDPSGRNKTRPPLSMKETRENGKSYYEQAALVLSDERLRIVYNSEWLDKINFADLIKLASNITVARMMERDDFTKRFIENTPISMHELLYPLAQAYDSVALEADVELGGTDQTFNLLMGRDLQRAYGQPPQVIMTTPLLEGTDGVEKMSKSYDNFIGLTEDAETMFGKIMSIPDSLIVSYYKYCTDLRSSSIEQDAADNPRDTKRRLAREIIADYHDRNAASAAQAAFDELFIRKEIPDDIPEFKLPEGEHLLVKILNDAGLVKSNGEGRRLIAQGAVKLGDEVVLDPNLTLTKSGDERIFKVGKRRFIKIL